MEKVLKFLCFTSFIFEVFFTYFASGNNFSAGTIDPKKYVINLDIPAEQRWTRVVEDYSKEIKEVIWEFRYVYLQL